MKKRIITKDSYTIKNLQKDSYEVSKSKGFWEGFERGDLAALSSQLLLIHSEVSEACELDRKSNLFKEEGYDILKPLYEDTEGEYTEKAREIVPISADGSYIEIRPNKPVSLGSELADIVIRTAQLAEHLNLDLDFYIKEKMVYNTSRKVKHGGKKY